MRPIFRVAHTPVADLEHVGIVPVPGACVWLKRILAESDARHRLPRVADVAGRAPEIPTDRRRPRPHVVPAVLTQTEYDWPSRRLQRVAHLLVDGLHLIIFIYAPRAAPVVLQVVDAPGRICTRVVCFVAIAAFVPGAR